MKKVYYLLIVFACVLFGFYLSSCNSNKIATPTNIQIDENNNLIWDKVSDAKAYEIKLVFVDTNTEEKVQSRKVLYSLDELATGDYEISISAISGTKAKNSDFSEPLFYHKYYESGCVYTLINNNTEYAVTRVGKASGTFAIEEYYRGRAVTEISKSAFKNSSKIENVTISANIETIGEYAFYNCNKLVNVVLPDTVRNMGIATFQNCKALVSINIPKTITTLPAYTFAYCRSLENVIFTNTLEEIGESAFQDCSGLKEIKLPDSVVTIGDDAFAHCTSLEKVEFGENLKKIGNGAFKTCKALTNIEFDRYSSSSLELIGEECFSECSSLESIDIIDVKRIDSKAFYDCEKLSTVTISFTGSIGTYAFARTKLYSDQYLANNLLIYVSDWVVGYNANRAEELKNITASTFKTGTYGIADEAFSGNTYINTLALSDDIRYIGKAAFANCTNLWKFTSTPDNWNADLYSIGDYAFAYCGLTNVSFSQRLTKIGDYAFLGNTQLDNNALSSDQWIPEVVDQIGAFAFYGTKLWNSPLGGGNIVYAGNWVVGYKNDNLGAVTLSLPDNKTVKGICDYAFMDATSLTSIQGLSTCEYIGKGAFYNCTSLTNVSLNRGLMSIADYTFYNCSNLVKVTFPKFIFSIGDFAFYNCTLLESADLEPTTAGSIGNSAFRNCTNLQNVTLSDMTKTIGDLAFYNCVNIQELVIPNKVTKIGKKCFYKNLALTNLTIGTGIEVIPEGAFYNCESLTSIVIPDSVKTIGNRAFYRCSNVETITLGNNVEDILDFAFYENKKVQSITFNSNLKSIGNYAFKGLENISVIVLPTTIAEIGQHAFYGCKSATFYTEATELLPHWHARLNSSRRPMFYGVTFDAQGRVATVIVSKDLLINKNAVGGISAPAANFSGWRDDNNNLYSMEDIVALELTEDLKLYAIYE